jgi:hypothetical protein
MESQTTICQGCGLILPKGERLPENPFHGSAECWQRYGELAAYTQSLQDPGFLHQTVVDAYEAQHAGGKAKPIAVWFGLIGLYLVLERGCTGREAQRAHMALGKGKRTYPPLPVPTHTWEITVVDVLAEPEATRTAAILRWAHAVWDGWKPQQATIRHFMAETVRDERTNRG